MLLADMHTIVQLIKMNNTSPDSVQLLLTRNEGAASSVFIALVV